MKSRVSLIIFFLLLTANLIQAQLRMSAKPVGYQYNQEHMFIAQHKVAMSGSQVKAYIQFILNSGTVRMTDYNFSYVLRDSYIDEGQGENFIPIDSSQYKASGFRQFIFELDIEREENDGLIIFEIDDRVRGTKYYLDIPLMHGEWQAPSFLFYQATSDTPYFGNYVLKGDSLRVRNPFLNEARFEIDGFENNAGFPMPPFDDAKKQAPSKVPLDTLYGTTQNEVFVFHNEGNYEITSPESPDQKMVVLVTDEFHPYYGDYNELIKPLIFVSTNEEYEVLRGVDFPRDAFESFVSETISSNSRVAKDFIKYYYRRIRKSARLFTSDREGWKTDRGMVYQIFGNPMRVFRNETTELWEYPGESGGRTRFIFDIIVEDGLRKYSLIRNKRYREDWMQAVTQWRAGRVIE